MRLENNRAGELKKMQSDYECFVPHNLKDIKLNLDSEMIVELKKNDMEKIRQFSSGNISNLLLVYEYLLKHPFVESEDVKNLASVSKPTVNKLLENLMDMEILELVEDKKRYRQYVYKKYVDILSEGTIL